MTKPHLIPPRTGTRLACRRGLRTGLLVLAALLAPLAARAQAASAPPATPAATSCPPQPQIPDEAQFKALAQAQPRDRGFLWRAQRDGRVLHLYGSLHLGRAEWLVPGPQVQAALKASKVLALELDLSDPATQRTLIEGPSEGLPKTELPPALQDRLRRQAERACVPMEMLAVFHPVMQALTLSSLEARREGLHGVFGTELLLSGLARAGGMRLRELETASAQIRAIVPDSAALRLHIVEQSLAELEQDRVLPIVRRLARAWDEGRFEELESYESWCDCVSTAEDRAMQERLIARRNPGLAAAIDALHREGEAVFAAVGALHMVGPQGLPQLLRQRGYTVERLR